MTTITSLGPSLRLVSLSCSKHFELLSLRRSSTPQRRLLHVATRFWRSTHDLQCGGSHSGRRTVFWNNEIRSCCNILAPSPLSSLSSSSSSSPCLCSSHHGSRAYISTTKQSLQHSKERDTRTTDNKSNDDNNDNNDVVLFERDPGGYKEIRSGVAFSCLHTIYWFWYATRFVPAVNASPMEQLHVDPAIGYTGIVFAAVIQIPFFVYPRKLISKLSWDPDSQRLFLYTHNWPWVRPDNMPRKIVPVGGVILDPASKEVGHVISKLSSDLSRYRGILPITEPGTWPPFLMHIRESKEIREPDLLLEALLHPKLLLKGRGNDYHRGVTGVGGGGDKRLSRRSWKKTNKSKGRLRESQLSKIARKRR